MPSDKPVIVYAEDTKGDRDPKAFFLRREGYQVEEAANGVEGLKKFKEQHEAGKKIILLTDGEMPKMGGPQLIQAVQEIAPDTPVIIHSANITKDELAAMGLRMDRITELPKGEKGRPQ